MLVSKASFLLHSSTEAMPQWREHEGLGGEEGGVRG